MSDDSDAALQRLARHVHSAQMEPAQLGPEATERVSLALLDLLGCFLASARLGVHAGLAARRPSGAAAHAGAALWGSRLRATPEWSALVNATVAHHAEFDGGWHGPPRVGAHPAVTVLPAALAVGECVGATGAEFVAAVAAGYDVLAAMACCLSPQAVARSLHPPGLLGSFGAAAAAARLLRADPAGTAAALATCGGVTPLCPFESFTAGATAKDLYGGWPAAIGVLAAAAPARSGRAFTLPGVLGRAPLSTEDIAAQLQAPALLHADFKAYPACRTVHPALTALEAILEQHPVAPAEVEAMRVETYAYAVELDAVSDPAWPIGARTSVLACLALRLQSGSLQAHHFAPAALRSPLLQALCARSHITVGRYAQLPLRGATVALLLRSGQSLTASVEAEKWSRSAPADAAQVVAKFHQQAAASLADRDRDELVERVLDLHRAPSLHFIADLLARAQQVRDGELRPIGPLPAAVADGFASLQSGFLRALGRHGADAAWLGELLDAVERRAATSDAAQAARARTLALALAPAAAGPVPQGWTSVFVEWVATLAAVGFSGPARVLDGPKGLLHLAHAAPREPAPA